MWTTCSTLGVGLGGALLTTGLQKVVPVGLNAVPFVCTSPSHVFTDTLLVASCKEGHSEVCYICVCYFIRKPRFAVVDRAVIDDILFAVDMSTNVVCTAHPSEYWISELTYV